jgi:hypothetical protein
MKKTPPGDGVGFPSPLGILLRKWMVVFRLPRKMMDFVSWDGWKFPSEWKNILAMFQSTNEHGPKDFR